MKTLHLLAICLVACVQFGCAAAAVAPDNPVFIPNDDDSARYSERQLNEDSPTVLQHVSGIGCAELTTERIPAGEMIYRLFSVENNAKTLIGTYEVFDNSFVQTQRVVTNSDKTWLVITYKSGWGTGFCWCVTKWVRIDGTGFVEVLEYPDNAYSETGEGGFINIACDETLQLTENSALWLKLDVCKSHDPADANLAPRTGTIVFTSDENGAFKFDKDKSTWTLWEFENPWDTPETEQAK